MVAPGAKCASHPEREATDTCTRCGSYVCTACTEIEEWETYCTTCYARVGKRAPASTMATVALILSLLAVSGCLPLGVVGAILGHVEVASIDRGESEPGGRNLAMGAIYVGWATTALAVLLVFVLMAIGVSLADLANL
ncbi:MAG: DUF4190 domain-containing protein [Sandaracinaceae bacterium]|nr:DUF4190 domain-containing protein [Sandaracinaceae bacterium]